MKTLDNLEFRRSLFLASALLPEGEGVGEARGRGRQYGLGSVINQIRSSFLPLSRSSPDAPIHPSLRSVAAAHRNSSSIL